MLRKVLFGALTLMLALCLVGCGGKKDAAGGDAKKEEPKAAETVKAPEGSADKAVLAYAQLYAYGVIEDENQAAAGMTEKDIEQVQDQVLSPIVDAFKQYPLSDESVAEMTGKYVGKLHTAMDMKATIKKDDATNPVVELTATTINQEGAAKVAETNEDLVALGVAYGELQAQGLTEAQLKESPEFQQFALESIDKYINEFPLNPESSLEVTCQAVEGSDGKMYWAPKDPQAVAKFVTGQK
ncbi:MAG: hypothetical protein IKN16_01550 [Selenomonadaceae bacterium]|nr:hypothetical protein [Selenomonadaceae bacterium]MBR6887113.1 hypothetical protein [Selenomonadaceae bacterium]